MEGQIGRIFEYFGKKAPSNQQIHEIKNEFAKEMLDVHLQAKKLIRESRLLDQKIKRTTAYQVALKTGNL